MEVMQLIGVAIISTVLCLLIKKQRPEIAMFIGILAGITILLSVIFKLNFIVESIHGKGNFTAITSYCNIVRNKFPPSLVQRPSLLDLIFL